MITYRKKNDKYILCKDGVYFALTPLQVDEMRDICDEILLDIFIEAQNSMPATTPLIYVTKVFDD